MDDNKKNIARELPGGNCLAGVALMLVALFKFSGINDWFGEMSGIADFFELFGEMLAILLAGYIVFGLGFFLYDILGEEMNKYKVTRSPLVKALLITLIATVFIWVIR